MTAFVLNMTLFALNLTGFVPYKTGLVLNMNGFVLKMTGFNNYDELNRVEKMTVSTVSCLIIHSVIVFLNKHCVTPLGFR